MIGEQRAHAERANGVAPAGSAPRWGVLLPLAAAVLTLATGAIGLGTPSYWFDEAASLSAATRSPAELLTLVQSVDIVHASYYVLLSGWIQVFGPGEVAVRALSLLALAAASAGFVRFAHRFRGPYVAATAGLLFVALPGIAWAGAEARGYSFALAACVWALVALQAALERGGGWRWTVYGLLLAVSTLFSIMTVLMVVAHVLYVRLVGRARVWTPGFVLAWVVSLVASIPLFLAALAQRQQLDWIDLDPARLGAKVAIGQLFLGPRDGGDVSPALISGVIAAVIALVLVVVALIAARGPARRSVVFAVVWFAVPTLALALPVLLGIQLYQERYLVFAAPGACLLIAEGILLLRPRRVLAPVAIVALLATMVAPLVDQRGEGSKAGDDYRALAATGESADAVVYVVPDARGVGIAYPDALGDADDAVLVDSPGRSGTLWGVNAPIAERADALRGRVAVYAPTAGGVETASALEALEAAGCVPTGQALGAVRFSVSLYDCGGR